MHFTGRIILLFCALLFAASCAVTGKSGGQAWTRIQDTRWMLVSAEGATFPQSQQNYLVFSGHKHMRALASCNTISGTYTGDTSGALQFGKLVITWKACPDQAAEARYLDLLKATNRYEYGKDELRLFRNNELLAVFRAGKRP